MEDAGINQTSMREIQRQIADAVPRGRWTTSEIRARVIARTEVKYAQNISSVETYNVSEDITSVVIFDAQIGPTDEECERLDGFVVTFDEGVGAMRHRAPQRNQVIRAGGEAAAGCVRRNCPLDPTC